MEVFGLCVCRCLGFAYFGMIIGSEVRWSVIFFGLISCFCSKMCREFA